MRALTAITALALSIGCAREIPVYSQREPMGAIETPAGVYPQYRSISSDSETLELSITTENNGIILEEQSFLRVEQDGICVREEISDYIEPSYAQQIMEQYALGAMFSFYTETRMVDLACDGTLNLLYTTLEGRTDELKRGKDFPPENDEMLEIQWEMFDDAFGIRREIEEWRDRVF
ncbi:MAG: hypothetical protein KJ955_06435 [Nanoarchaeota archaeon]|nr:hypothetical protein [Nanoarchaeota archaeon]